MYHNMLIFSRLLLLMGFVLLGPDAVAQVADFENLDLEPETYWNGSDKTVPGEPIEGWRGEGTRYLSDFTSGGIVFMNEFAEWQASAWFPDGTTSWAGWAYSNTTDTETPSFENQFSAYTGGGVNNSENYAVYYGDFDDPPPTVTGIPAGTLLGAYLTNTTYAALSMRDGDSFAKKFEYDDWFKLMITGLDAGGQETGSVDFYLADYTGSEEADWYIVGDWTWVHLTSLGAATQLQFSFQSSDVGDFGMNTPAYFAMDNLTLIPEPTSFLLLLCGTVVGMVGFGRRRRRRMHQVPVTVAQPAHSGRVVGLRKWSPRERT